MNYKRIVNTMKGVRMALEEGCGVNVGQITVSAANLLEDVCRAFALGDDEIAEVLGEVEANEASTVIIPILRPLTGGPEDEEMWKGVHAFFDSAEDLAR